MRNPRSRSASGLQVDATSHADEWQSGLLRLDHQARSNARHRAVSRNRVTRPLRCRLISVARQIWRPETFAKAHFERYPGDHGVFVDDHPAA